MSETRRQPWAEVMPDLHGFQIKEAAAMSSPAEARRSEMSESTTQRNKPFVLEAFETLFNKKDFVAAEKFWSPNYIQHSAHIPPGRDGLFTLVKSGPPGMKYENSLIMAEGDILMLHGRFSGLGLPANWIVVDIIRIGNGLLTG